jgi:hypothetical protein
MRIVEAVARVLYARHREGLDPEWDELPRDWLWGAGGKRQWLGDAELFVKGVEELGVVLTDAHDDD